MNKPKITIHDAQSGQIETREMNNVEYAQYQIDQEADAQRQAKLEAKAAQRQAILDRLGLTADEAKLILG